MLVVVILGLLCALGSQATTCLRICGGGEPEYFKSSCEAKCDPAVCFYEPPCGWLFNSIPYTQIICDKLTDPIKECPLCVIQALLPDHNWFCSNIQIICEIPVCGWECEIPEHIVPCERITCEDPVCSYTNITRIVPSTDKKNLEL